MLADDERARVGSIVEDAALADRRLLGIEPEDRLGQPVRVLELEGVQRRVADVSSSAPAATLTDTTMCPGV